jgi:hypothetical protein
MQACMQSKRQLLPACLPFQCYGVCIQCIHITSVAMADNTGLSYDMFTFSITILRVARLIMNYQIDAQKYSKSGELGGEREEMYLVKLESILTYYNPTGW